MKDLITLWKHTRMVVLVALTAAVYAAILIAFKAVAPLIPGITEIRPANVVPVVCSLMFGPAGAWGSALGNLVGDLFGTFGPGSAFGFVGNFLYGYIPYKLWGRLWRLSSRRDPYPVSSRQIAEYVIVTILASGACAFVIAWGVHAFRLAPPIVKNPFITVGWAILLNNAALSVVLGIPLLRALYPRVRRWGLMYRDVMPDEDLSRGRLAPIGVVLLFITPIPGLVAVTVLGVWYPHVSPTIAMLPVEALMLIGAALL
jgi:energy-coupling factor transport system substrate-specific component